MSNDPQKPARLTPRRQRDADRARQFDLLSRLRAVAPDPDGEHLWLLVEPAKADGAH